MAQIAGRRLLYSCQGHRTDARLCQQANLPSVETKPVVNWLGMRWPKSIKTAMAVSTIGVAPPYLAPTKRDLLIGMGSRRRSASQAIDPPSHGGVNLGL
jgi:hypothetical protein